MQTAQFENFLSQLHQLSPAQIRRLRAALSRNDQLQQTWQALQEAGGGLHCHHCGSAHVVRNGFEHGMQRVRCKDCGRSSNCVSNTPLSRLRNKEKFTEYAECLAQGMTLREAAQKVGLNLDRAFRWRHRFLAAGQVQGVKPPRQDAAKTVSGSAASQEGPAPAKSSGAAQRRQIAMLKNSGWLPSLRGMAPRYIPHYESWLKMRKERKGEDDAREYLFFALGKSPIHV
ncbi:hypothetical protein V8J88_13065 [Massilia sp. W12]|uniref:transposase-like zinc-binding domain-containing protein n=1 Tax=Massilia sp. W12 TaxID=3126507 RepID=UPI0030D06EE3